VGIYNCICIFTGDGLKADAIN